MLVAYDGAGFHGFAAADGVRTVMGEFGETVERVLRTPVQLTGAGRTDAGVHAWGQVISGRLPGDTDLGRLRRSLNGLLGPEIAVREVEWADDDFDARFSATSRAYRYDVWNAAAGNPLLRHTSWHVVEPLDVDAMNAAAASIVGEHDFTSFCRRPKVADGAPLPSLVRVVEAAAWHRVDDSPLVRFEIRASSFCHQMVRSIVGTLVDVGRGRRPADSISATVEARDRTAAGPVAPPTGLVLWEVGYEGERWDAVRG